MKLPFFDLIQQGRATHEAHWPEQEVQLCTLLSIKTGGCSEDCSYCAQSARYSSGVESERLLSKCTHHGKSPSSQREWLHPLLHGRRLERRAQGDETFR